MGNQVNQKPVEASNKTAEQRKAELMQALASIAPTQAKSVNSIAFSPDDILGAEIRIGNIVVGKLPSTIPTEATFTDKAGNSYVMLANDRNYTTIGTLLGKGVVLGLKVGLNLGKV